MNSIMKKDWTKHAFQFFAFPVMMVILMVAFNCCKSAVPHKLIREDDVAPFEVNDATAASKVLIASRSTDYKEEIVQAVSDELGETDVYIKVTGVGALKDLNADDYDAVLIIGTAMAWTLDPDIQDFLDRFPDNANIIVYSTSSDGEWLPETNDLACDTVSGASDMAAIETKATELTTTIRGHLK